MIEVFRGIPCFKSTIIELVVVLLYRIFSYIKKITAYHCDYCNKIFKSKRNLNAHKRKHKLDLKTSECDRKEQVEETDDTETKSGSLDDDQNEYQCFFCDSSESSEESLVEHFARNHNFIYKKCLVL